MSNIKEKSVKLYILKYIYREVRDKPISTSFLYHKAALILGIPKKQMGNWLHILVNEGLLLRLKKSEKSNRSHHYVLTQKGCQFINNGMMTPVYKPKNKIGYCYNCNVKTTLYLYKAQYYCGQCLRQGDDSEEDLRLEDFVYKGVGYIW
jgi:predicted transcriptional regulator